MGDAAIDVAFWAQITGDAKRAVACHPADGERLRATVAAAGLVSLITVIESQFVDQGHVIVADVQALEAGSRAELSNPFGWYRA